MADGSGDDPATPQPDPSPTAAAAAPSAPAGAPEAVAGEEGYWERIRGLFPQDRDFTWLSHGAGGAVPRVVLDHMARCAAAAATGAWDVAAFKGIKESGSSAALRQRMARTFGCGADEIALTRNAMEALATCLLGIELRAGDEVVASTGDYDSCIAILKQRQIRDGIALRLVDIPAPAPSREAVLAAYEQAITPRTRIVLTSHMAYGTGQILPVREICALARRHGAISVVDGAHSIGHLDFRIDELGCDCFASCLHKWFMGPRGTGILHVRRERIADIWPLFASYTGKAATDIEKFEEYGTVSKAVAAALPLAFDFNEAIGIRAKEARLRHLRDRWAAPLRQEDRIRFWTSLDRECSCAVAAFQVDGLDPDAIAARLRDEHGLRVRTLGNPHLPGMRGLNIGMTLVNSVAQADRFAAAVLAMVRDS